MIPCPPTHMRSVGIVQGGQGPKWQGWCRLCPFGQSFGHGSLHTGGSVPHRTGGGITCFPQAHVTGSMLTWPQATQGPVWQGR